MMPMVLFIPFVNPIALTLYAKFAVSHALFGGMIFIMILMWLQANIAAVAIVRAILAVRNFVERYGVPKEAGFHGSQSWGLPRYTKPRREVASRMGMLVVMTGAANSWNI